MSASYTFILHVQTIRLKLKGPADVAKFCIANSKVIQQANPIAARHGGASVLIGSLQAIKSD